MQRKLTLTRSRKFALAFLVLGSLVLYGTGVVVRSRCGIRVLVHNRSGKPLHSVTVRLEHEKKYSMGEIGPGQGKRIFVDPAAGDSIRLEFTDADSFPHGELVAGYVEGGYCGDVTVQVEPGGRITSRDNSFVLLPWKSWLDFL